MNKYIKRKKKKWKWNKLHPVRGGSRDIKILLNDFFLFVCFEETWEREIWKKKYCVG